MIRHNGTDDNDIDFLWEGQGAADVFTADANLSLTTWYFIEIRYDFDEAGGSDTFEMHIYNEAGTEQGTGVSGSAYTVSAWLTPTCTMRLGNVSDIESGDGSADNFMTSNDKTRNFKTDFFATDAYPG
jgi:hypothetical protein